MSLYKKVSLKYKLTRNKICHRFLDIKPRDIESHAEVNLNFNNFSINVDKPYWFNYNKFKFEVVTPKYLSNAYVIGKGIVVDDKSTLHLESTTFQESWLSFQRANHLVLFHKLLPQKVIKENIIPLAFYLDQNYFHWVMEALLRLAFINEYELAQYKVLLDAPLQDFHTESLELLFNIKQEDIILKNSKIVKAPKVLLLPFQHLSNKLSNYTNLYSPEAIIALNQRAHKRTATLKTPKDIIITRVNASERRFVNIEKLSKLLPDYEIINLENKPFEYQLNLFAKAENIIAIHGAGLVNLMWSSSNAKVIELFPNTRPIRDAFYFFQITAALRIKHHVLQYNSFNELQDCELGANELNAIQQILN
jgi:hypothetical protein